MKKRQTNRPHRAALALLAGALAVFVGLGTFREAGWPRQQLTLTVEAGDPAALQGFTVQGWMSGAAGASGLYGSPRLNFRVEDGVLTSEAVLHYRRESDEMYGSWSEPLTVPAADHDRVDAAAVPSETSSTGGALFLHRTRYGHLYDAETDRLELMGQANFYQGGRYLGSVRLDLGTLKLDEPVTVRAQQYEGEAPTDYHLESGEAVAAVQRTCLEDRQGQKLYGLDMLSGAPEPLLVVSPLPGAGLQRGIYRATELLTDARLNALPADTTVAGQPLRSAAAPYGAVELVFPLEAGERIFTSPCPLADGTTALLTCKADNTLRLRVLDASWQLLATTDLEIPAGAEEDMAELRRLRGTRSPCSCPAVSRGTRARSGCCASGRAGPPIPSGLTRRPWAKTPTCGRPGWTRPAGGCWWSRWPATRSGPASPLTMPKPGTRTPVPCTTGSGCRSTTWTPAVVRPGRCWTPTPGSPGAGRPGGWTGSFPPSWPTRWTPDRSKPRSVIS